MSLTNALDVIAVVGAIILAAEPKTTLATIARHHRHRFRRSNVVGGFLITDRVLKMFKSSGRQKGMSPMTSPEIVIEIAYVIATALFIRSQAACQVT